VRRTSDVGIQPARMWRASRLRILAFFAVMGPGLITASADNDAQGITTYAVTGARTGYSLLWLLLLVLVSLVVTQEIGARLGMVTGKGLGSLIRERYGVRPAAGAMALLLLANLGTTTAEFAGIAAALQIFGISKFISVPSTAVLAFFMISRGSYKRVERIFLIMSLLYVSYVLSGFLAHPDWSEALHATVTPHFTFSTLFLLTAIAMVGTTVTPWGQFFIQAYVVDKGLTTEHKRLEQLDVFLGGVIAVSVAAFIIVAAAATIHSAGGTIVDAKDAALALAPLAGRFAATLFALGLLNAAFMASGVLPLSTAYAICESFGFELGVDQRIREAPVFYGVIAFSILFGAGIVLLPGAPLVPILFLSAALNAVLLAPILVFLYLLANDGELMGTHRNGRLSNALTIATIVMLTALTVILLIVSLSGG